MEHRQALQQKWRTKYADITLLRSIFNQFYDYELSIVIQMFRYEIEVALCHVH